MNKLLLIEYEFLFFQRLRCNISVGHVEQDQVAGIQAGAIEMTSPSSDVSAARLAQLPEIRTLVLDDSRFDRKRIRRIGDELDLKLRFEEASSVTALRECLDRQNFDLFLIDYMMPESDGLAALEIIRSHQGQSDSVSIMISGQADQRVAVSAMKGGCQDFIVKSDISAEFFQNTVLSALRKSRQFARYFDQPKPFLDLDEVRSFLQIALQDSYVRDILREAIQIGLQDAVRVTGLNLGLGQEFDLSPFLQESDQSDAFLFR